MIHQNAWQNIAITPNNILHKIQTLLESNEMKI